MWILKPDSLKAQCYAKEFWKQTSYSFDKTSHKKNVPKQLRHTRAFAYLTYSEFNKYLIAMPHELLDLHSRLFTYILNVENKEFIQEEWEEYLLDNNSHPEYATITSDEIQTIKHFFNYDYQISDNSEFSYYIAELLNTNTCTYCNRQYTLTIRNTKNEPLIRPEFDHWFAQTHYPDLALSFYNLIPSCSFCNSIIKNKKEMSLAKHIHPYIDKEAGFEFTYHCIGSDKAGKEHYGVECNVTATGLDKNRVENTLEFFRIKEVYNAHAELELKDLIDLAIANPGNYIDELVSHVLENTQLSKEDIFRILFGIEILPDRYLNRPFSKFKMDIINKIHDILMNNR